MLKIGELVPDFELLNQDSKTVKLSDYRGKRVLLVAFPRAMTGACTDHACGFRDVFPKIEAGNAVILGITPDVPKDLLKWKQQEKLPYDLLSDPDASIIKAWDAWGEKTLYGKKFMGVLRSHWLIGEDGKVLDVQVKIAPKESVKRALKSLL